MPVSPFEIYNYLPRTNCKKCGHATCMSFAAAVATMEARPEDCPLLLENDYKESLEKIKELIPTAERLETGLIITDEKCIGCGICVVVCEENQKNEEISVGKGPRYDDEVVLRVEEGKVRLVAADRCKRTWKTPVFCRACVEHCPTGAIDLV